MAEYEIAWQVYGTRTVSAGTEEAAFAQVSEWLEDDHDLTSSVAAGWDYTVMGVR